MHTSHRIKTKHNDILHIARGPNFAHSKIVFSNNWMWLCPPSEWLEWPRSPRHVSTSQLRSCMRTYVDTYAIKMLGQTWFILDFLVPMRHLERNMHVGQIWWQICVVKWVCAILCLSLVRVWCENDEVPLRETILITSGAPSQIPRHGHYARRSIAWMHVVMWWFPTNSGAVYVDIQMSCNKSGSLLSESTVCSALTI